MKKNILTLFLVSFYSFTITAQETDVNKQLKDFDQYMAQTLKAWNTPGACVGIVV